MIFFVLPLLIIAVFLQGTVTTLPLTLIVLLCFLIAKRSRIVFYSAFFAGLLLDVFTLQPLGYSTAFFLIFLYLILLYEKKYEINSYPFVIVSVFLASILFGFTFGSPNIFIDALESIVIAVVLYSGLRIINKL